MRKKMLAVLVILSFVQGGKCAYPGIQEAKSLFASNCLNSAERRYPDKLYEDFFARTRDSLFRENSGEVERIVLSGVASIDVLVSTNKADDSIGIDLLKARWIRGISRNFYLVDFLTNAPMCLKMAKYIGSVNAVDFPSDCLRKSSPPIVMKSLNGKKRTGGELRRVTREDDKINQCEVIKKKTDVYKLQQRVSSANSTIERFRRDLFALCSRSVKGCREIMSDCEFTCFTNRIVVLSGATNAECDILFKHLYSR